MSNNEKDSDWNIISLDEYEDDRLRFLSDIMNTNGDHVDSTNNFKYIHDNKNFLRSLDDKIFKIINSSNKQIYEKFVSCEHERDLKNIEFFKIVGNFSQKYNQLYYRKSKKLYEDLFYVYLPLSRFIYKQTMKEYSNSSIILGIQAHIGCGKTTFCEILTYLAKNIYDLNINSLSIDDIYSTYEELKKLKMEDPRFKFRGPPGTHDIKFGEEIFESVKNLKTFYELPRYNKSANGGSGDRSKEGSKVYRPLDVLIFEGWFLGAEPVDEQILEKDSRNPSTLEFQKIINNKLNGYVILWNHVDYWMVLKPFKYEYSTIWRKEAEKNIKVKMDYKTFQEFINYFWDTIPPYIYFPKIEKNKKPLLSLVMDLQRNFYL